MWHPPATDTTQVRYLRAMWEPDDDWEPIQVARRRTMRIVALLVAVAMVLALVLPVLVRIFAAPPAPPPPDTGVRALVVDAALHGSNG